MAGIILPNPTNKSVTDNPTPSDMFADLDRSRLIDEPAAAEILSLKTDTLRKWRKAGRGPAFIRIGRSILYRIPDIESFILAHLAVSHA